MIMAKQTLSNIKLGVFVISGLVLLVLMLYIIGKNQSLFTSNFEIKVCFKNVDGLTVGNNVRFSGIQSGTVKKIRIINDTTIEVSLLVDKSIKTNIRKNSIAYIGSEGLMGNKVVNIVPNIVPAQVVDEGDMIQARPQSDLNDALGTLYQTNDNVAVISRDLLQTMYKINNSVMLNELLNDTLLLSDLQLSLRNVKASSEHINNSAVLVHDAMTGMHQGQGVLGVLLSDKTAESDVAQALANINAASDRANRLVAKIDSIAGALEVSINNRDGLVYALLQDTAFAGRLGRSLNNVESGTAAFNEDMEALKHNFLLKGYFKKKDKLKNNKNRKNESD